MDFYLDNQNVINRMIREFKQHGSLIIAYDFDNTVFDFHREGHSYNRVIDTLVKLKQLGCELIVFTARSENDYEFIVDYLKSNDIPFDKINENSDKVNFDGKKIYYNVLIDDRAGLSSVIYCLEEFIKLIERGE